MQRIIFLVLLVFIALSPTIVLADHAISHTIAQLQEQIATLQAQLTLLRQQAAGGTAPGAAMAFGENLFFGMVDHSEVRNLQGYLAQEGLYAGPITGNYFTLTRQAVRNFQARHSIPQTGYFGPLSRNAANVKLQNVNVSEVILTLSADPTSGRTPLAVNFTATLRNFISCGNTYAWDFGDGITGPVLAESCAPTVTTLPLRTIAESHTYERGGIYQATIRVNSTLSNIVNITAIINKPLK